MTPDERYDSARAHRYCVNCLATSHRTGDCDSPDSCRRCGLAHHTLLHRSSFVSPRPADDHSTRNAGQRGTRQPHRAPIQEIPRRTTNRPTQSRVIRSVPNNTILQNRIRNLFDQAVLSIQRLQDLVEITSPQARRHVEDMSENLIEFED